MRKSTLLIVLSLLIFLAVLQPVYSIGLAHGQLKHYFEPNKEIKIAFQYIHVKPGTEARLSLEGELSEYATMTDPSPDGKFYVTLTLPAELSPGAHGMAVVAEEIPTVKASTMIATLTRVKVPIRIVVPYEGQYLELKEFHASNANIGQEANFKIWVINWGTEIVTDAKAKIDVYNPDGDFVSSVTTDQIQVNLEEEEQMNAFWDTTGMVRGVYSAIATITYSDNSKISDREDFRVGELLVGILNYTKTLEIGGVKEFIINVKSEWSGTISNVYGTVEIDGKEFKTTPVDLETFQTGKLVAYVNTDDFEPKIYNGKITLLYGEDRKTTVEDITVTFIEAPEEQKQTEFNMMYAVVIVLVIIIFILLFLFLRKSGSQGRRRR